MSNVEEKNMEIIKKAKELLPDGGYSEKELNLAFSMFIKGYHQAEKDHVLTYKDVARIFVIATKLTVENTTPMTDKAFYQEVLKRFNEMKSHEKE